MLDIYHGPIQGERKIQNMIIEKYDKLDEKSVLKKIIKDKIEKLKHPNVDYHAWVKVNLNGKWYNADPTWDADYVRNGLEPTNALKTDKECKKDKKLYNPGPVCNTVFPEKSINKLFSRNNIYIGNFKILNIKDLKGFFNDTIDEFKYINNLLKRSFKGFTESLLLPFKKTKALPEGLNDEKYNKEFEQECGYTIDELRKMGISKKQIDKLLDKYDSMTGERLDRKKIVEEYIRKKQEKNKHTVFLNNLKRKVEINAGMKENTELLQRKKSENENIR